MYQQVTYDGPSKMAFNPIKSWELSKHHNVQCHLGQSEDYFVFRWLRARVMFKKICNMLSRIWQSIGHPFKHAVNTFII